ncbi:MAG: hypothetical protein ACKPKT_11200 [Dolichospermum sp.]
MNFDQQFTQLLRRGDIAAAKNLLVQKYPHLKNDSDRLFSHWEHQLPTTNATEMSTTRNAQINIFVLARLLVEKIQFFFDVRLEYQK